VEAGEVLKVDGGQGGAATEPGVTHRQKAGEILKVDGGQGGAATEPPGTHRLEAGEVLKMDRRQGGAAAQPEVTHRLEAGELLKVDGRQGGAYMEPEVIHRLKAGEVFKVDGRQRDEVPTAPPHICDAQLCDTMTTAISFMVNPGPFRGCCRDTAACWDQATYLEGELPCPSVLPLPGCSALGGAPVLERNIGNHKIQRLRVFNIPQLGAKSDGWMAYLENLAVVHFENLTSLQTVGDSWLRGCTAEAVVDADDTETLRSRFPRSWCISQ
jgi:hypothetical protein